MKEAVKGNMNKNMSKVFYNETCLLIEDRTKYENIQFS